MNAWMDSKMVEDIVNEKDEVMNRNQNWVIGERIVGVKKKRVDFFIRVKTRVRFYELKSKVWNKCVEEGSHVTIKNAKINNAKWGWNISRSACTACIKRMAAARHSK